MSDPALQAACHSHALLVLAAFLEDRLDDGQIKDLRGRRLLVRYLREAARQALPGGSLAVHRFDRALNEAIRRATGTFSDAGKWGESLETRVRDVVFWRASSGFVVTAALASGDVKHPLRAVFSRLALALQWLDDFEDVIDDVAAGRDNLLGLLAEQGDWLLTAEGGSSGARGGDSGYRKAAFGCPVHERALGELGAAASRSRQLGLSQLADEIEGFAESVVRRLSPELAIGTRLRLAVLKSPNASQS